MTTDLDLTDNAPPDYFLMSDKGRALLALLHAGVSTARIEAIGRWRGSWTPAEVRWAKRRYIDNAPTSDQFIPTGFDPEPNVTAPRVEITTRQGQVLDGMCRGLDIPTIAAELGLAPNTVEQYARQMVRALGAVTADDAVHTAITGRVRLYVVERRGRPAIGHRTPVGVAS